MFKTKSGFRVIRILLALAIVLSTGVAVSRADTGNLGAWGDQGNGTYINPILPGDYSDIDVTQADSIYYMISSTFWFSPGMVILKSYDMVNWTIAGHAVPDLTQMDTSYNYTSMNRAGKGIWAGSIRYYQKKFWVYYFTPDEGLFMTTATTVAGPWAPLTRVVYDNNPAMPAAGWDDCCPFWDADSQAYMVCTNYSNAYAIHLFKMTADGKKLIAASDSIIHQSAGSEANKLYKINGYYYHFYSESGHSGYRVVFFERSRNIYGPYTETKQVEKSTSATDREPNQGGLLQDRTGGWWFVTHQGTGKVPDGRTACLLPVTWVNGWPILGNFTYTDTIGTMVWSGNKPIAGYPVTVPQSSDNFNDSLLALQWEWSYQPRADKWSLTARPGFLRLSAFRPLTTGTFFKAGNTLTQRYMRTDTGTAIVKMDISHMANGEEAGLSHFAGATSYATIGVVQANGTKNFKFNNNGSVTNGAALPAGQTYVWLRSIMSKAATSIFAYSLDSISYTTFGGSYTLTWGNYRGDRLGIYNYNNTADSGYVDVDWFTYVYAGPKSTQVQSHQNVPSKNAGQEFLLTSSNKTLHMSIPASALSSGAMATLTLYSMQGRAVWSRTVLAAAIMQVKTNGLACGMYMGRLTVGNHAFASRILTVRE